MKTSIVGIDPGIAATGYGIIHFDDDSEKLIECGCIKTSQNEPVGQRLKTIFNDLNEVLQTHKPDILAIEQLFFSKNVKTAMRVGEARGVILLSAALNNVTVYEYTPLQVKQSLVGYGRASKDQVKEMVLLQLGLDNIKGTDDTVDAVAIAICHIFNERLS